MRFQLRRPGTAHVRRSRLDRWSTVLRVGLRLWHRHGCRFDLGLDAIGIEPKSFLCDQARKLMAKNDVQAEVWQGNFLPAGAHQLAEDTDPLVSLTHRIPAAYHQHDMPLSDFAIVFYTLGPVRSISCEQCLIASPAPMR